MSRAIARRTAVVALLHAIAACSTEPEPSAPAPDAGAPAGAPYTREWSVDLPGNGLDLEATGDGLFVSWLENGAAGLMKLDERGQPVWRLDLDSTDGRVLGGTLARLPDGDVVVSTPRRLTRLAGSSGEVVWSMRHDAALWAKDAAADASGNVWLTGFIETTVHIGAIELRYQGHLTGFVAAVAPDGSPIRGFTFGGGAQSSGQGIAPRPDGTVIVGATCAGGGDFVGVPVRGAFAAALTAGGEVLWTRALSAPELMSERPHVLADGRLLFTGQILSGGGDVLGWSPVTSDYVPIQPMAVAAAPQGFYVAGMQRRGPIVEGVVVRVDAQGTSPILGALPYLGPTALVAAASGDALYLTYGRLLTRAAPGGNR